LIQEEKKNLEGIKHLEIHMTEVKKKYKLDDKKSNGPRISHP